MTLFEHQQFWPLRTAECAGCDIPYYETTEEDPNWCFQVGVEAEPVEIDNSDFADNPFEEITSGSLSFTFGGTVSVGQEFILYTFDGADPVIFRFKYVAGGSTTHTVDGNVHYVTMNGSGLIADIRDRLALALVAYVDPVAGTTTAIVTNDFTLINIPDGSYIDNSTGYLTAVATVTSNDIVAGNFIYTPSGVCYIQNADGDNFYQFEVDLVEDQMYKFDLTYSSEFSDFDIELIVDDGTNPPQTKPFDIVITSGSTATVTFIAEDTATTTIKIKVTDGEEHGEGFCFQEFALTAICGITQVTLYNTVNADAVVFSEANENMTVTYYNDKALVCINAFDGYGDLLHPTDCHKLIIEDSCENTISTNWFKFYTPNCGQKLIKLEWFNDCRFGDLDYANLAFTNAMYIKGYIRRIPQSLDDRVSSPNPNGSVSTVFSVTAKRFDIRIGKYSEVLHEQLERIYENKFVLVNGVSHYKTGKDVYSIRDLDNNNFTGSIELTKAGTELIASSCCC